MEVLNLPFRKTYCNTKPVGKFPAPGYGTIMSRQGFKDIIAYLQFSEAINADQQILDFIDAVNNARFSEAIFLQGIH